MVRVLGLAAFATGAQEIAAQTAAGRSGFSLVPSLSVRETLTSNVRLESSNGRSDLVTEISPQVRLNSNAGRIKGSFDYSLRGVAYARETSSSELQQALSAQGVWEAIEKRAYIDASASISQQSISALGTRSFDNALIDSNRTEVTSFQLSPYVVGQLGSFANYEARWTWASTSSKESDSESTSQQASLRISSDTATFARLSWQVDLSHQTSEFGGRDSRKQESVNGTLFYAVTPETRLLARAGRESNDLTGAGTEQYSTWGFGGTWAPSQRTRLEVSRDHRFFGNAYNVRFNHRAPRSVWTFSTGQDVNTSALTSGGVSPRTVFDLLFEQFASIAPDPVQRTALVDSFLQNNGLTRTSLATGEFLTSAATIQRRKTFSVALLGLRSTVLFSAFHNESRSADPSATGIGDLSNGNNLRQRGLSVNLSHRLTPQQALSMDFSLTNTNGTLDDRSTDLRSLTATWTNRLNKDVDLTLLARRTLFGSSTDPYNESALVANLRMRF